MAVCLWLSLQRNVDKDQVKAAIKAQQDQQIDNVSFLIISIMIYLNVQQQYANNIILIASQLFYWQALLAEGRFYSDLELTEKEIERMVMEASRAEYLADDSYKQQLGCRESSTSGAEPSSSGASEYFYSIETIWSPNVPT